MPFKFSPGHCGPDCGCEGLPGCEVIFDVTLCDFVFTDGATISVWDDATKARFLGSGVSDSSGQAIFTIHPTDRFSWYWEATFDHERIGVASGEGFDCYPDGGGFGPHTEISLVPAAGYYCDVCRYPLKDTLYYSDPFFGDVTLVNTDGTGWKGSTTKNFPGGTGQGGTVCTANTQTVQFVYSGGSMLLSFRRGGGVGIDPCITCADPSFSVQPCTGGFADPTCPPEDVFFGTPGWGTRRADPTSVDGVNGTISE